MSEGFLGQKVQFVSTLGRRSGNMRYIKSREHDRTTWINAALIATFRTALTNSASSNFSAASGG
jgi:hypothetical protein